MVNWFGIFSSFLIDNFALITEEQLQKVLLDKLIPYAIYVYLLCVKGCEIRMQQYGHVTLRVGWGRDWLNEHEVMVEDNGKVCISIRIVKTLKMCT